MPKGQLMLRPVGGSGEWLDAYDRYGVSFTDASLSKLMTPAPNKDAIESKSRLEHGKRVVRKTKYVRKDERDVDIEMHLTAPDRKTFWQRYAGFCDEILDRGFFDISHVDIPGKVFRMTYLSCTQFSEFAQRLAKYTLRLNEPDPDNRGLTDKWEDEEKSREDEG